MLTRQKPSEIEKESLADDGRKINDGYTNKHYFKVSPKEIIDYMVTLYRYRKYNTVYICTVKEHIIYGLFINYLKSENIWEDSKIHYEFGKPKNIKVTNKAKNSTKLRLIILIYICPLYKHRLFIKLILSYIHANEYSKGVYFSSIT
mgnify:CR=1 FL=1